MRHYNVNLDDQGVHHLINLFLSVMFGYTSDIPIQGRLLLHTDCLSTQPKRCLGQINLIFEDAMLHFEAHDFLH